MTLLPRSLKGLLLIHESTLILLVIVTALCSGLWAYFWLESSRESLRLNAMLYDAQRIRGDLLTQVKEVNRARLLEDPAALSHYQTFAERIDRSFARLGAAVRNQREQVVLDYMRQSYQTVREDMDKISTDPYLLSEAVRLKILDSSYEEWMLAEFESALVIMDEMIAARRRELERSLHYWTRLATWMIPLAIVAAVALLAWSWRTVQRNFVNPMQALTDGARRLSQGDLQQRVETSGVSEAQRLAVAFNEMASELSASRAALLESERQAALGALVPVVAHNIRNPLASIRATAQVLDADDNAEDLRESQTAIIDTVDRLERWVSALLSYLHPLQPQPRATPLIGVIEGALAPLRQRLSSKRIALGQGNWELNPIVQVDVDLLEQALYGLLNNAVEAAPADTVIRLDLTQVDGQAVLTILDQGSGIPFQPEPRELSPGPTTKRFGTGLGIPFAFKVCQAHGGELVFATPDDGGTEVVIRLPLAATAVAA